MKIIKITSRSATISLECSSYYFIEKTYDIFINGIFYRTDNRIIFSLFDLKPDENYIVFIPSLNEKIEFKTRKESNFLNIDDFGIFKDEKHLDSPAFQCAISCLKENGTLFVGKGKYYVGPLFLKSNMTLYLDKDAELIFSTNRNDYPIFPNVKFNGVPYGTWQGDADDVLASLINIINCENVSIIGQGKINGNALNGDWYENYRIKRRAWRPFGIYMLSSKNITIQGIKLNETPSWCIHPYFSQNIDIIDTTIINPSHMPTTDGIDIDSSSNVNIIGCYISVGDDCIAIKSGTFNFINECKKQCSKDICIKNCFMEKGHGGVVFGSESSSGIENVFVENCYMKDTERGFRLKTRRLRGQSLTKNVIFKNINMDGVLTPFVINMFYNMGPAGGHIPFVFENDFKIKNDTTPVVENFVFENIICNNISIAAGVFLGLKESMIKSITFKNCSFEYNHNLPGGYPVMIEKPIFMEGEGFYIMNVENFTLDNVKFKNLEKKIIVDDNVNNIVIK